MKTDLLIICIFTLLSLLLTYPLILHFTTHIPGVNGDGWFIVWSMWQFKESVLKLHTPYFSHYIFYPTGVYLILSEITPLNSFLSIPLQLLFGLIPAYNILFLFSFILSGYSAYKLSEYFTKEKSVSFVSGVIYAFSPFHFAHALGGHLNILSSGWIPLYILYLFKTFDKPNYKNAIIGGFFLSLLTLSSLYYLLLTAVFTVFFIFYKFFVEKQSLQKFFYFIPLFPTFFILTSHYIIPVGIEAVFTNYSKTGGIETLAFSADLAAFFLPTSLHPILPRNIIFSGNAFENNVFIGYSVLCLIFFSLKLKENKLKFWKWALLLFFILSLGPFLKILNTLLDFPLPYVLLYFFFPFFSSTRTPSRFDVFVMLCAGIIVAYALLEIIKYLRGRKYMVCGCISALIIFEFLAIPFPLSDSFIPPFYVNISKEKEDFVILNLPILYEFNELEGAKNLYYQTIHKKRMIGGCITRLPSKALHFLQNTPIFYEFLWFEPKKDIIDYELSHTGLSVFNFYNIKYVIFHKNITNNTKFELIGVTPPPPLPILNENYTKILKEIFPDGPFYDDGKVEIYKVNKNISEPFLIIGEGWSDMYYLGDTPTRQITNQHADIVIKNSKNQKAKLSFVMLVGHPANQTLSVYLNEKLIEVLTINATKLEHTTQSFYLSEDEDTITFLFSPTQNSSFSFQHVKLSCE